jgi:hypothetical protein
MLLLAAALQLPAAPPPKTESKPLGPAPRVVLLNRDGDGQVRIQAMVTETRKVTVRKTVVKNGKTEVVPEERDVQTRRVKELALKELENLTVFTADGKEVNRATALEKLASGGVVVVTSDGGKVDPTFLKAFKDDTLVLVSPQLMGTPVRPTSAARTTGVLNLRAVAAPAILVQGVPAVPAVKPAAAPPKVEKKDEKKDEKKEEKKK